MTVTRRVGKASGWTAWRTQRVVTAAGPAKRFVRLSDEFYESENAATAACERAGPGKYRLGRRDGLKQVKLEVTG